MPFIPHSDEDIAEMLTAIGAHCIEDRFDEILAKLRIKGFEGFPPGSGSWKLAG